MSTIIFKFFWIFGKFVFKIQFFSLFAGWCYAGHIFNVVSAREGDLRVPKPERPPSRSHPVGHGTSVTSSMCNALTFVCMLRCSVCDAVPNWFLCSLLFYIQLFAKSISVLFVA